MTEEAETIAVKRRICLDQFISKIGDKWLSAAPSIDGGDHPFTLWYHEFLQKGGSDRLLVEDTTGARLAAVARDVIEGWDVLSALYSSESALVKALRSRDRVWGVLGEAFVICELKDADVAVAAVPVARDPTPDLIASNGSNTEVDIDVKVRHFSDDDKKSQRFWVDLYGALREPLRESGWVCEIEYDGKCPPDDILDKLSQHVRDHLTAPVNEFESSSIPRFRVSGRRLAGVRTGPRDLLIRVNGIGEFARFEAQVRARPSFEGRLDHVVSWRRRRRGDHVIGLRRAIRNAGRKFVGDRPGLVPVLLSDEVALSVVRAGPTPGEALFNLANTFAGKLKNSYFKKAPHVSEVRLYVQTFPLVDGVVERHIQVFGLKNETAKYPLPDGFGLRKNPDFVWNKENAPCLNHSSNNL